MDLALILSSLEARQTREPGSQQQRLYQLLRRAILDGTLAPGLRLPATRHLANVHGMARNSVLFAYDQLKAEGLLESSPSGTRVATLSSASALVPHSTRADPAHAPLSRRSRLLRSGWGGSEFLPFAPGVPELNAFPWAKWVNCLKRSWREVGARHLAYSPVGGDELLRHAVAAHLRARRGVVCTGEQVLLTSGAQMALDVCARVLADEGEIAWMESPGYPAARAVLKAAGLATVDVPVDADGLAVDPYLWHQHTPRVIFVTPSHQYPMGGVLSLTRRTALIDRARISGTWIVEDDYDSEFHYGQRQITSMQGLAPEAAIVYVGTFSKSMYPSLRIGYMVVPAWAKTEIAEGLHDTFRPGQAVEQRALAHFIESGELTRHLSRMRKIYEGRQASLRHHLNKHFGEEIEVFGGSGGTHLTVVFNHEIDDSAVAKTAAALHVTAKPLSAFCGSAAAASVNRGLVLGYGAADENIIGGCVQRLKLAYDQTRAKTSNAE